MSRTQGIGAAFSVFNGVGNDRHDDPVRTWWTRLCPWAVGANVLEAQTRDIKYVLGKFDEIQSVGVTKDNWWVPPPPPSSTPAIQPRPCTRIHA